MSMGRRFTVGELTSMADEFRGFNYPTHWPQLVAMLDQAAETESQVMGLVELIERAYREGFRAGMVDSVADESGFGGVGEDAYWSGSNAREALSKFRGEA